MSADQLKEKPSAAGDEDGKAVPGPMQGYAPASERPPLISYAITATTFNVLLASALVVADRQGRKLPERVGAADLVTIGVASHKLSRLIAKDKVTSPLRAPFTRFEGSGGPSEYSESARGTGARRAIGELLVCPYCLGLWVVAAFSVGLLFAPRVTRFIGAIFSASDPVESFLRDPDQIRRFSPSGEWSGAFDLRPAPGGRGTEVSAAARRDDLRRAKQLFESGEIITGGNGVHGRRGPLGKVLPDLDTGS